MASQQRRSKAKADGEGRTTLAGRHRYELRAVSTLTPNARNARKHPRRQIAEIRRSYEAYGVINPIIVAPDLTILAGHGRYEAAMSLGLAEVPVLIVDGLTPAQLKAYAIADNKIGDMSSFDMRLVLDEIEAIQVDDGDFDITLTGFATAEIDAALGVTRTAELNDLQDDPPAAPPMVAVTRPGDLWQLGGHRLVCGDATDAATIARLVDGAPVRLVLSDVPFNVKIKGNVSGLGRKVHEEFAAASGEMSREEFVSFLSHSAAAALPHLIDGAMILWFIDWRHVSEMLEAGSASGFELKNILAWVKSNPGMGSLWRSQHELICAFKHGATANVNNIELGVFGRNRSNVLQYPGMNAPVKGRGKALDAHPTVKPVALIADLMLDVSNRGDVVLDPFGGSGTAIIAAEKVGRLAYLAEITPGFVDVSVRRWEALGGDPARLAETGQTFAEIAAERLAAGTGEPA